MHKSGPIPPLLSSGFDIEQMEGGFAKAFFGQDHMYTCLHVPLIAKSKVG